MGITWELWGNAASWSLPRSGVGPWNLLFIQVYVLLVQVVCSLYLERHCLTVDLIVAGSSL